VVLLVGLQYQFLGLGVFLEGGVEDLLLDGLVRSQFGLEALQEFGPRLDAALRRLVPCSSSFLRVL